MELTKYHYWRGFKACLVLIVLPLTLVFILSYLYN